MVVKVTYREDGQLERRRPAGSHVPQRRCIACGRRGPQEGLIRFSLDGGSSSARVVVDGSAVRAGRGAYLCPRRVCLEQALRRRAFQRAFRRVVELDPGEIRKTFEGRMDEAT